MWVIYGGRVGIYAIHGTSGLHKMNWLYHYVWFTFQQRTSLLCISESQTMQPQVSTLVCVGFGFGRTCRSISHPMLRINRWQNNQSQNGMVADGCWLLLVYHYRLCVPKENTTWHYRNSKPQGNRKYEKLSSHSTCTAPVQHPTIPQMTLRNSSSTWSLSISSFQLGGILQIRTHFHVSLVK